jgi:hypothetical protein
MLNDLLLLITYSLVGNTLNYGVRCLPVKVWYDIELINLPELLLLYLL